MKESWLLITILQSSRVPSMVQRSCGWFVFMHVDFPSLWLEVGSLVSSLECDASSYLAFLRYWHSPPSSFPSNYTQPPTNQITNPHPNPVLITQCVDGVHMCVNVEYR